jgi:CopG family transcriptional regulator, nickel-responsive regulator
MADLVRFGIAMEGELLAELDGLAAARGCTRSELLRDLVRREVERSAVQERVPAVAAVTLVYNHHVRQLSERLTSVQHALGDAVRSTMHVHLDDERCLEVVVMRGRADRLRAAAEQMLSTRGVTHGGVELVTEQALRSATSHRHEVGHSHEPGDHGHAHAHPHGAPSPRPRKKRALKARR